MFTDPGIYIIFHGAVIIVLGNISLIQHIFQNQRPARLIRIRMFDRIVFCRTLGNCRQYCRFRNIQFTDTLSKITVCRCLYTKRILSQIDGIQVTFQNFILTHDVFQLHGKVLLLQLSFDLLQHSMFGHEVKYIIFQKLLGNGTCTLRRSEPTGHKLHTGTQHTLNINSVMVIKTFIFNGNKCFLHMFWNIVKFHIGTVGSLCDQLCSLVAVRIIDRRFVASRKYTRTRNIRSILDYSFYDTDPAAQTCYAHGNEQYQQRLQKDNAQLFAHFTFPGLERLLLSGGAFFTVIH